MAKAQIEKAEVKADLTKERLEIYQVSFIKKKHFFLKPVSNEMYFFYKLASTCISRHLVASFEGGILFLT